MNNIRWLKINYKKIDIHQRQIFAGIFWVGLFVLLGKVVGAAKEMAIAWRYGISSVVDAYIFMLNLIGWPIAVWFSILSVVLLPLYARLKLEFPHELPQFRSELLGVTLILGAGLALAYSFLIPILLKSGWLGLSGEALNHALEMINGMAIVGPLGLIISFFSASLLASGTHRNTLFEAIPAATLLVFLIIQSSPMVESLVIGTTVGYLLHAVALGISLFRRGELSTIRISQTSYAWKLFWTNLGIMSIGQALSGFTSLVDQFFAAGLVEGSLATLGYSNRILALILGLGATTLSRAALPVFSDVMVQGGEKSQTLAKQLTLWIVCLSLIVLLVSWVLSPWGVRVLFERGAFTANNTQSVTEILRLSLFQVVFYFPSLVLIALLAAKGKFILIAASGGINLLSKIFFSAILAPLYGIQGLVLSTVLMYFVSLLLLLIFCFFVIAKNTEAP